MTPGNCSCGAVTLQLFLPRKISTYTPRSCDCDFCTKRAISFLSNPKGSLIIISKCKLHIHRQGSMQALFLACGSCQDVVAVVCKFNDSYKGAINATLLKKWKQMRKAQIISPNSLSSKSKIERWNSLWFRVEIYHQTGKQRQ